MKIIWVSKDSEVIEMVEEAQESAWLMVESPSEAESLLEEGDCAVFLDYDLGVKECDKLAAKIKQENCSCFLLSGSMSTKDIKKHQDSKNALSGYFQKPVDAEDVKDFLESLDLAVSFTATSTKTSELDVANSSSRDKTKEIKDPESLTFIGAANPLAQDKTVMKAVPQEIKAQAIEDFDADFDDNVVDISGSSSKDTQEQDEDSEVLYESAEIQEFKMDDEVKNVLRSHEMITPPDMDNPVNVRLQKQFDAIFGEKDYSDLEQNATGVSFNDDGLAEMMAEVASAPAKISIDLGTAEPETTFNELSDSKKQEESMTKKDEGSLSIDFDLEGMGEEVSTEPEKTANPNNASIELDDSIMFDLGDIGEAASGEELPSGEEELEMDSLTSTESNANATGGLDLGNGDDDGFELETSSSSESAESSETASEGVELSMDAGDDFELETTGEPAASKEVEDSADELSFDGDEVAEDATKTETSEDLSFGGEEFDYKTSMTNKDNLPLSDDGDDEATKVLSSADLDSEFDVSTDDDEVESALFGSEEKTAMVSDVASVDMDDDFSLDEELSSTPEVKSSSQKSKPQSDDRPIILGVERVPTAMLREDELMKLHATLEHLRKEREELVDKINRLKEDKNELQHENTGLKADLDEVRIELSIVKKRSEKDYREVVTQLKVSEEKRSILEQKCRSLTRDWERVNDKVRIDVNKVRQKEKELESKLELHSIDSEAQVRARDQKILELKRKIDSLEFNMENASIREHKSTEDKRKLEDKLRQVIQALRNSIQNINEDFDISEYIDREDKKA